MAGEPREGGGEGEGGDLIRKKKFKIFFQFLSAAPSFRIQMISTVKVRDLKSNSNAES